MIAKGNLHAHGTKLAAYLVASSADERAELVELRGFAATNIRDAFIDVQMQAAATRATKPFFHAYVRAPEGEALTPEMWKAFADRIEKRLGFGGQPRAVAFHHGADSHMHVAWSRIDLDTLTAIDPGLYKNKMKQVCRELEDEFGLTRVTNERSASVRTKSANRPEFEQSRRLGTDLNAIRNTIYDCWKSADNGRAFTSALAEAGLVLSRGDRRDFVVIDHEGGEHALSKRITGATAAETRKFMVDIDRATLPGVDEAKALQRDRPDPSPPEPPQPRRKQAMSDTETIEPDVEAAQQLAQRDRLISEAARLGEAERVQAQMPSARNYREQMERDAEEAKRNREQLEKQDAARLASGDINDAYSRYAQALGATYSIRDPYGSLANAAMVEYGSFYRQQDALRKEAAAEQNPEKRQLIELRRQIEGHDYMAITSERLAGISRSITMGHNAGSQHDDELAKTHKRLAGEKREERAELQREIQERAQAEKEAAAHAGQGTAAQQGAVTPRPRSPADGALLNAAGGRRATTDAVKETARSSADDALLKAAGGRRATTDAAAARTAQQEQDKQREGLRPDQPSEGAPPTKEQREAAAADQGLRSAAGRYFREQSEGNRDRTGQQSGTPKGRGGGQRGR